MEIPRLSALERNLTLTIILKMFVRDTHNNVRLKAVETVGQLGVIIHMFSCFNAAIFPVHPQFLIPYPVLSIRLCPI